MNFRIQIRNGAGNVETIENAEYFEARDDGVWVRFEDNSTRMYDDAIVGAAGEWR